MKKLIKKIFLLLLPISFVLEMQIIKCADDGEHPVESEKIARINIEKSMPKRTIQFPNGALVKCAGKGIAILKFRNGKWTTIFENLEAHTGFVNAIIQLPNYGLASCSIDGTIIIWEENQDNEQWDCIQTLNGHTCLVSSIGRLDNGDLIIEYVNGKEILMARQRDQESNQWTSTPLE